jgi:hypothetical protein
MIVELQKKRYERQSWVDLDYENAFQLREVTNVTTEIYVVGQRVGWEFRLYDKQLYFEKFCRVVSKC